MSLWHHVLPQPQELQLREDSFLLNDRLSCDTDRAPAPPRSQSYEVLFQKALGRAIVPATNRREAAIRVGTNSDLGEEEFILTVREGAVEIAASSYLGVARAAATLGAYKLQAGTGFEAIRGCAIRDWPRYPWRGVMVDTVRHFFSIPVLEGYLDTLFLHKISFFHFHLSDDQGWRFPVADWPRIAEVGAYRDDMTTEFGQYGGYYTLSELTALDQYARDLGITIIPEVDLPGHTSALLAAYPELSCTEEERPVPVRWGIFEDVLCTGKERSFELVSSVVETLLSTFSGPYIHLGGDETPTSRWRECPACRKRLEDEGLRDAEELHGYFMDRAAKIVESRGKRPVVWDEAISPSLSRNTLVMCWRGRQCVDRALSEGFSVVAVPQERACYFDHKHLDNSAEPGRIAVCTVKDAALYEPGARIGSLAAAQQPGVVGIQGNLWTEEILYARQLEYMSFPRVSVMAENGWREPAPWEERSIQVARHRQRLIDGGVHAYPGSLE